MCECLRGIFRVTWTPSSDADSDREDSHVFSRTRDPAVKDKRRSPPPRSPAGPQHSGLTDEQESPERTVQKEKLHAELKQVLSQKRSHLRESTCQLAQPEMDCEPTDEQTGVEDDFRKSVEIVVETDAEVGASGYSVTGGGERGIFVKDVLKDSPAAKHLSLQQGDQLLSAKVYFDNVRYEDALKILQCAEPYKVSFQLKRTVPETEVSVRPRILGGDVKGPKAKVAKMSVKGTKLFKTQRRRGGRFGLKRLKEKNKEDVVMEGTPPSLEAGDVDVEFSLPTFRQRKGVNEAEPVVGKGKKRIRFPHMKTKSYTGAVPGGKLGIRRLEVDENIFPPETSGAEVKTKGKGHKFGIAFPKSKHNKSGSAQTGSLERKPPEVRIHPPSVEFDVSSVKDVEKRGLKLKSPDVEFALPSGKAGGSVSTVEETSESKAPKGDVRREADAAGGKVHADISKGDAKLRMPKLKLPKVRLSRHSDEIDSALQVKTPKAEMKGDDKIQLPEGPDIRMPKVEGDLSGGAASVQIPSVEISLPKVKGTFDADVSLPESGVKACVNMPDVEVSGSEMDLQLNAKQKVPDEVEGMFKGLKISMPKVDISLPKTGFAGVEGPGVGGKISLPSVDISLPQMKSGGGDVDMGCYVGGDGKFKMPEFDPTFPDMKSSDKEEEGNFKMPKVDLNLPIGKAGTTDDDGAASQLPSMEVSLPKMKRNKVEVSTKGGKLKMPEVKFSPPKGNIQGGFEVEGQAGKEGKFKMPTVDVLMPKLKQAEGPIEGPEMMSGVEIQLPSNDASLPTAKMKGNIEIEGPSAKGGKFTMPPVNIKLPQMGSTEAGVDLHGQKMEVASGDVSLKPMGDIEGKVKGGKFTLPSVDICLPKMKLPKGDVTLEGPDLNLSLPSSGNKVKGDSDGGKFKMPTCDISLQKGKIKEGEMNIREPEVKGEKFQMPSFDVSLPQIRKRGEDVDVELPKLKGGEIKAPTIEISPVQGTFEGNFDLESDGKEGEFRLHGMKFPEGEGNFQGPKVKGAKFEMPKIDLSLPRGKTQGAFHTEIHSGKDGNKEMASCDFDVPKGELSADINVDGLERKTEKFKLPKIDISLPKLNLPEGEVKFEGPETKGQMEKPSLDIIPPEGKLDVDVDGHKAKGSKFHMPTININLPKIKSKEVSIDVKGPEGEEGKLPSCDITLPDKEFPEANVSLGGPNVKGGQINVPGVEGLLPETNGKVGMSVETPEGNLEKLQMPKFDIAIPKVNFPDSAGKMKKPDLKIKKMKMPDIDIPLSKGKAEIDIEIDGGKGKKFHIPSVDFSLPRIKTKGLEVKTGGVEEKIQMPDTDVSLSEGKVEVDTNVGVPEVKGGKFKMPKFDISFSNKNLPEGKPEVDISTAKGKIKEDVDLGGKLPTVDFSPPKMQAKELHVDIKPPETTNLHISSPKVALPGGDVKIECPDIKGRKIEMPDIDLSLPKGKGKGDIETTGSSHKGGKFHMPAIDITLPKMKTKGAEVHVESPEVKGGQIKMPSLHVSEPKLKFPDIDDSLKGPEVEGKIKKPKGDISLPKGEVQGDLEVEGPDMKGGKFKMPKFDVSLPKVSLSKIDASVEGPDLKGKAEMPSVDISVPKGTTDLGVDVDPGKGSKFHMPSLDITLPKMKTKGLNVNVEGPEVKGDMSLSEVKSPDVDVNIKGPEVVGGYISLPNVDVAFPKTKGDFEVEVPDMKDGKFKMPKFDVSLPKVSLPKFDANVKGPDLKGKAEMPSVDISVPKATTDVGVDVDTGKGSKFHMPSLDISLPKMKAKGFDVNIEGPEVKGDISLPEVRSPDVDFNLQGPEVEGGKLSLPKVDIALPKTEGDFEVEGPDIKGGKFKMPKFDVSLPKVSLPKFDASVEGPDLKGKAEMQSVDISVAKGTTDLGVDVDTGKDSKFHMPSLDITLPKMKSKGLNVNVEGPEVKGDMSLSEVKSPDVDVNIKGPEVVGGYISLPNVDVAFPKTEGDFEVEGPDMKGGKFKMPKLPKVSLPEEDVKVNCPDINVGKIEMPDIDISLPKGKAKGDAELEGHTGKRGQFHLPAIDISLPKIKTNEPEIHIKGPEVKGGKIPDIDFSLPRGEVDADLNLEGPERRGQVKMPKVDVSLPKFELKVEGKVEGIDAEGKTDKTNSKISLPEEKVKGNVNIEGHSGKTGKFHLPSIDFSLPKIKVKGKETEGLKCKGEISIPKENLQGTLNVEGSCIKESECTTPTFDVSLSKMALTDGDSKIEGPDIKGRKIEMPDIDLSLPKGKGKGDIETTGSSHKGGKFYMPAIDITLPKMKTKGAEVHVESPKVKGGQIKIPSLDVSGPKLKSPDIDVSLKGPEVEGNIKNAKGNISLPKGEVQGDFEVEGPEMKGGKFKMPKFDVFLPKVSLPKFDASVEGPDLKGKAEMPSVYISVPKSTTDVALPKPEGDFEVEGPDIKGGKFKMPKFDLSLPKVSLPKFDASVEGPDLKGKAEMQSVDISVPKATTDVEVDVDTGKGSTFHMPSLDISLPKIKAKGFDVNIEGPEVKGDISLPEVRSPDVDFNLQGTEVEGGKLSLPKVNVALPKIEGDFEVEGPEMKGGKFKMPKFDVSLPKVSLPKFDASVEGPDLKGKAEIRSVEMSVPKGTTDFGVDVDTGKFYMPSLDISLPKMKGKKFDVNVEGPEVKGDISLPEVRSPDVDFNLRGSEVEGGTLSLPNVDIALPKTEGDIEVEGPDIKGGKFKMPKFDLSLPKVSLPKFDASVEGPDLKGKAEIQSVDISVPKGTTNLGVDVDTGKGSKFHMPSLDISLPKMKGKGFDVNIEGPEVKGDISLPEVKSPDVDFNLQGPEVKGGKLSLPKVDIALPKTEGDIEVEGPDMKVGKFKMPKFDLSLPKVSLPKFDASVEGPDLKGKAEMQSVDISVPKGTTDLGVDVDTGKDNKFHMPSLDLTLPKMKTKGLNVNVEGPEVRGDMPFPKIKTPVTDVNLQSPEVERGDVKMPTLDVSLPKPEGDSEIQGPEVKGGKYKMPKLPKVSLPEANVKVIGPDINVGKIEMPDIDISLPKGKAKGDAELEGHTGKRGKFHLPAIDISLPKIKTNEPEIHIKGPEVKGGKIPDIDFSLPRGEVDADLNLEGPEKRGQVKMPKVDVSFPQIKLAGDVIVKGPEMKGKITEPAVDFSKGERKMEGDIKKAMGLHMPSIDLHLPKVDFDLSLPSGSKGRGLKVDTSGPDASADVQMSGIKGQLKPPKIKATDASINTGSVDNPGASLKLPTVKLPTVDISAPKVDLDFGLTKSIGDEVEVQLLKAEGGRPLSGGSFDLPDVSLKAPSFTFPRFGGKSKSSELQISKSEVFISPPDVEGEVKTPSVEFDDEGKVKVKKNKIKIPSFRLSKKDPDVSVSCPDVDVKGKKENVDIQTQKISVEGSSDKTKYKVKLPKFKISSPTAKLPEKEGDMRVEADGKGGFHAPDVTIKLPKFSMPGLGSKEKDLGKPVGEVETKTKLKMPSVELSLQETKTPDTEVVLPKAEVDVSEADIRGYEGNLKVPKMPKIDDSIPKVDPDVSLPKGKSQKIEKPDMDVKGEGKFKIPQIKMPSVDIDIPKGKSVLPDVEVDVDRGKFNMPYVKMPSVDITLPKPKTGKALNVDAEGDVRLRMPDIKMPNVNISEGTNNKLEGPNVDIQGRGKLKTADVYASDLETPDGKTDWDSERSFKMPSVDISLPKGKLKGNNTPEMEMGVEGEGKVKLPHMKMPDFDVSFPKRRTKDSQMEIKDKGGKLKTPNVSTPPIDISLSTGKDTEVEESSGGKFKMPIWKRPDVDIPLPKGHMEGPEVESTGERGGLKMPHISLPYVDISLPKRKADAPHVERGDGEEKCTTLYMKMPSVDPNVQLKGEEGPKFQMPHVKMPNIEFSLPKGKDIPKLKTEREEGKVRMPSVDISIPTGKIPGPNAEAEGGQGPHIKMPHVNITLPRGKSDKIDGAELETEREGKSNISHMTLPSVDISLPRGQTNDNSPDIKGERKKFKMAKEDFSLPKGRSLVEGLDVDIKGDPSMAAAKAEGGHIKLPHMKFPKVDISLPKGRSRGTSSSAIEMDVTSPEGNIPKVPSSKAEIELPTAEAQCKLKVPQGAHLDSSSEGNQASLKLKIPTIEIKSPKEDLELQTGSHKEEGNKDNKKIELPDLDLTLEGSGGKGKGPKNKGAKFKIRKHKKKTCKDTSAKPQSEEEAGEQVKHNSSKDGVNVQLPGVTPPTVSLKTKKCDVGGSSPSTAEVRVPRIPDIEFDIGTSQDEEDGQTENKIKIPKFGIPLPSISSPERLAHGPDIQYEGPKIPKVKKAVFVLVNPSEPDDSVAGPSLQKEQTKAETEIEEATVKISKKKSSFGKSKDKSATESAERRVEEEEISRGLKMKMPKVKFSPAKSGSFGVKGDSSSPNGEKDASPHKDDKGTFGGKLKLPKVELTSPYGKMAAGEENKGARFQKDSSLVEVKTEFRGLPAPAESAGDVVTSHARTEMLDRDRSEIPDGLEFSSAKVQMWSESKEAEERESSSWFKVPKVTLKPLSSGFLQITPEGSPQAERKGEVAGMEDVSGSFCIHASGLDFAAQQMSEEHHASEEGTVTMVTKTTRITQQIVTSQTHTAESSTTTSGQVSDSNF
ncbi:neuroblast differentiation-associated protein AHNAK isoform X2 [Oryzias latipes]|uniref:neuroblast differentiation-associated protein AHNAK isoform X2 n=1 Tax=Oryzias latipes TaxID=8090 RepID=UPI000CE19312|nr:neuroblast differentiation-associated protein AHNAK isoform X2 [Oryzias latipes]